MCVIHILCVEIFVSTLFCFHREMKSHFRVNYSRNVEYFHLFSIIILPFDVLNEKFQRVIICWFSVDACAYFFRNSLKVSVNVLCRFESRCAAACVCVCFFFSYRWWLKRDILLFYIMALCWVMSIEIYANFSLWSISISKNGRIIIGIFFSLPLISFI